MLVNTARFGPLEAPEDKLITMERPILGFEDFSRFCLIELEELSPFLWMQSTDDPAVAFLVVNPVIFCPDYRIVVNPKEIAELKVTNVDQVETWAVVTIHQETGQITVNLQGPILINTETGLAKQLVLVNSDYQVDYCILEEFEPSQTVMETEEAEVAV